ncbi:MAG TPA: hypothetical protein DCY22_00165 [Bacteroides graminisolvens]|nr:hypothetical protein [Bacteroides graminisolvens]
MEQLKKIIGKNKLFIIGAVAGAIGGYFYWLYVGCASGTCPITSSPFMSTVWGAVMGGLLLSIFQKDKDKSKKQ